MAELQKKISELPVATTLGSTDTFPVVQGGITKKATVADLAAVAPAPTVANDSITNAKLANVDQYTIKSRITAGTGDPEDVTPVQLVSYLPLFTENTKGLVPSPSFVTPGAYLNQYGGWTIPVGSGSWGNITGLMSTQADLTSALAAKQSLDSALTSIASGTWANYGVVITNAADSFAQITLADGQFVRRVGAAIQAADMSTAGSEFVSQWSGARQVLHDETTGNIDLTGSLLGSEVFLDYIQVNLTGNATLVNPVFPAIAGFSFKVRIKQDATGSRTLAYGNKWKFPGGTVPTLTTTANAIDLLECVYDSTSTDYYCQLTKAYA